MKIRVPLVIPVMVAAAMALAACGTTPEPSASNSSSASSAQVPQESGDAESEAPVPQEVKIQALSVSASDWPAFIAEKRGIFADHGLDVEFVTLVDAPAAAAALEGGDYDLANLTLANMGPLIFQGRDFRLVAQDWTMSQVLLAKPGSSATSLDDVFPLTSSTPVGTASLGGEVTKVWRNLQRAFGGDITEVNVQVDPAGAALLSGAVEFGLLNPNIACVLEGQGAIEIYDPAHPDDLSALPEEAQRLSQLHTNGYWATGAWAEAHPDAISRVQAALDEAITWIRDNPVEAAAELRGSDFDLPTLSDADFEACVTSIAPTFSSAFPTDQVDTWNAFLQTVEEIDGPLPAEGGWLDPGVPRE